LGGPEVFLDAARQVGQNPAMIVSVPLQHSPYDVHVGPGLLDEVGKLASEVLRPGRCALISDSHVAPLHAGRVEGSLRRAGFAVSTLVIPAGENSKCLNEAGSLCEALIAAGLDRSSAVFALGGGVVGDLVGFVAAIFYRGIPCIQLPTTIVAQVDSSVGGKTGVNATGGKNLIGSFHQPRRVIADTDTLATLPAREFNQGFAEVIKHAAIRDFPMLDDLDDLPALIARNVEIKATIVAEDEFETRGVRALLNFGHTIGHGIENAAGYGRYLHGEAISLGLVAACRMSVEKAGLDPAVRDRLFAALARFQLPMTLPPDVATGDIVCALRKDKKFSAGMIRFILLNGPGEAFVSSDITETDIVRQIETLRD
jgi:3-dehydroquinate synthase